MEDVRVPGSIENARTSITETFDLKTIKDVTVLSRLGGGTFGTFCAIYTTLILLYR